MAPSADERDERLAQIIQSHLAAAANGESVSVEELIRTYPEFADDLRDCLSSLEFLRAAKDSNQLGDSSVGDYRIKREIGRGGMGIVYEAEQISLSRPVALKVVMANQLFEGPQIERFKREAQAAARLHHPNIVPVYDVGRDGEKHFYAMQFIEGASLDRVITQVREIREKKKSGQRVELLSGSAVGSLFTNSGSWGNHSDASGNEYNSGDASAGIGESSTFEPSASETDYHRKVARLFAHAADALNYAHSRGIVHRDVKPSNFILDTTGKIWLMDFGLAKIEESNLTKTHDVLGTLRYMAPEVYRGETTKLSDLFGLGLTLFEFLALRPAYDAIDRSALVRQITCGELRSLHDIVGIPNDLDTIVMKLLRPEPADRYASGAEVRDDLDRFVEGKPILARPVSAWEKMWRWCKRNRLAAFLATVSCLLLVLIAIVSSVGLVSVTNHSNTIRRNLYAMQMVDASKSTQDDAGLTHVASILDRWKADEDLHGWEWYYLSSLMRREFATLTGHASAVYTVDWSQDGSQLLSASQDGTMKLWSVKDRRVIRTFRDHTGSVRAAFWSPDGSQIASGGNDGVIVVRDVAKDRIVAQLSYPSPANTLAWSPDGKSIAAGYVNSKIAVWNVEAAQHREFVGHNMSVSQLTWHPSGETLASCAVHEARNGEGSFRLWNVTSATSEAVPWTANPQASDEGIGHSDTVFGVSFCDGGSLISAGQDRRVIIWDGEQQVRQKFEGHQDAVYFARLGRSGRLYTAGRDCTIRVWNPESGNCTQTLRGHTGSVRWVEQSPDGRMLASAGGDGTIRFWHVPTALKQESEVVILNGRRGFAWGADSSQFASGQPERDSLVVEDIAGNRVSEVRLDSESAIEKLALDWSHDGCKIAVALNGDITIIDINLKQEFKFKTDLNRAKWIQWCSDNRRLFVIDSGAKREIQVYDALSGERLCTIPSHATAFSAAWSPDGRFIAGLSLVSPDEVVDSVDVSRRRFGYVKIWDSRTGNEVATLPATAINGLAWHPNGASLATTAGASIKVWDIASRTMSYELRGHRSGTTAVTWSPNGQRLASGDGDGNVKIWEPTQQLELFNLHSGDGTPVFLRWSPDGRKLGVWTWGKQVRIWDATLGYVDR